MSLIRELYKVRQFPVLQNRMYNTKKEARACSRGDIRLVEDLQSGLIYNADFCPQLIQYDEHYQNEQAVSPLFRTHLQQVADIVEQAMTGQSIIEVGCGKGFFLEMLEARNLDIIGCDPTYEGNNVRIIKQNFTVRLGIHAECVILRHVLEHIQNPIDFLNQILEANKGVGKIYIEVPCFDWIIQHKAWFDVFYEHVNYFRLNDFFRMFETIYESGRSFGGQYLYVLADLATLRTPKFSLSDQVNFPSDFTSSLNRTIKPQNQKSYVIWGGASKGVIFALRKEQSGIPITHVIDINPAKQHKYLPATGLYVQMPEEVLPHIATNTTIFVMNSNYIDEIIQMSGNIFNYIGIDYE